MSDIKDLKEKICTYLKHSITNPDTVFTLEYPEKMKPVPLGKCRVSIGFDSLCATTNGLDDFIGEDVSSSNYGKQVDIVARFEIAVPERFSGTRCHMIFEEITQALMINQNDLGVTKMWCDNISFDKTIGGFTLTCHSNLSTLIYTQHTELIFDSFQVLHKKGV